MFAAFDMDFDRDKVLEFDGLLSETDNIVLVSHSNPDGDAVASTVAMYCYLNSCGKNAAVVYPNEYPSNLGFLFDGFNPVIASVDLGRARALFKDAGLVVCLDFNRLSRASEELERCISQSDCKKVLIDHHVDPAEMDMVFSDPHASSTSELVYKILKHLSDKSLDIRILSAIYVGLCTDTGCFSYSCGRRDCFDVAAELAESGVPMASLKRKVMDEGSENRLRLLGFSLLERMKVFPEHSAAYIALSRDDLQRFDFKKGDLEGVVNYCLRVEGVRFGALLSERSDRIRMSFRSTSAEIDVNRFASDFWNGGGHVQAAGGTSFFTLDKTIEIFENQIRNNLHETKG